MEKGREGRGRGGKGGGKGDIMGGVRTISFLRVVSCWISCLIAGWSGIFAI